ncbi:hypothetical protein COCSUDRAFT_58211 [Coccomyxa subellipsoidea C-169]|uniref:Uncharacterized protein n=1 Tax=Coccomyxa subellipsoidea (strain C-169) TaxID=574566 RepID=I0YNK6_COCSC|nr:hypothetical protein COCSUDRAFT_58211 [Coccomyxa subellipsoidea C-169]EIE19975.1 hypothetical protein COCSUDRAFT_58211 [Coccomyxa subellipsoidea C-169]|eukprot:XP_005644519.1 hypothetical protein COCSUDRAFT_58211 [Coccomyxa subellipsoidea C-169]
MATAAPSLAPEAAHQPSQLLSSPADQATHSAAAAPAAASDLCLRTLQIGATPASMIAVSQAAADALISRPSGPITGGPDTVPIADLPSRSGGSAAAAAPRNGAAADGTVAEGEPDDGMTEEWFASEAETPSPYSLNLRQHRKVHGYFVEHVARMVFKHRRTHDSDARLRQIIARARCHDMVPQVLARLRVPLLVQLLYEHPNPHVASQARELNKREEWKTALHLMREEAIKQMGITHKQADAIAARMVEEHAVPAAAPAADNADITAELASDVADTLGNTGRRRGGKRGKCSNKHASPPPAVDRAATVPARGASKRPQTVLVPGRKRLRTLSLRDETAQADPAAKEQAAEDAAMDLTTDADVAKVQDPAPVKRGPGRPRKGEKVVKQQRKQKPAELAAVERLRKRPLQDEEEQTLPPVASQEAVPVLQQQAAPLSNNAATPAAEAVKSAVASVRKRARRLPHAVQAIVPMHTKGATARETAAAMAAALVGPAALPSAPQPPPQPPHVPEQPREQLPGSSRLVLSGSGLPARPASAPVAPALQTAAAAAAVSAPAEPPLLQHRCEPRSESAPPSQIESAAAKERGMEPASVATPDLQGAEDSADDAGRSFSRSPSLPAAAAAGPSSSLLLPFSPANFTTGNPSAAAHVPASTTQSRTVPGVRIQDGQGSPFRSCPAVAPKPAAPGKLLRQGGCQIPAAAAPVSMSALMPVPVAGSERQDEEMGSTAEAGGAFYEQRGGVLGQQGAVVSQQQMGGSLTEQGMQSSWWQADGSVQIAAGVGRAVAEAEDMQSDSEEDQRAACANSATAASPASAEADAAPAAMDSETAPGPEKADGQQDMAPEPASPQARPDRGDTLWGCSRERADSEPLATKLDGVPISPPQVLLRRAQSLPKGVAMCAPVKAGWLMDSIAEDAANVSSNRQATIGGNAGEPRPGDRAAPDQAQHAAIAQEDAAGAAAVASTAAAAQLSAVEAPGLMESDQSPARVQDNHRDAGMSAVEAMSHSGLQLLEEGADSLALRSAQPPPPPPRSASGRALLAPITLKPPGPATALYMQKPPGTARGAPRPNRSPISPGRGAFPNRGAFQGRGHFPGRGSDPARPAAHRGGRDFGGRRFPWSRGPPQQWPLQPPPAVPLPVSPIPYWLAGPFQQVVGWGAQVWGPPAAPPVRYVGAQPAPPVAQSSGGAGGSST